MLFDATVIINGKHELMRGNQNFLDGLEGMGYQIIDKKVVSTVPRVNFPKDKVNEELPQGYCSCCNGVCQC